jgi:hypothetical protein
MHSGFVIVGADIESDIRACAVVSPFRVQDYDCVVEAPCEFGEFLAVLLLDGAGYGDDVRAIGLRPARKLGVAVRVSGLRGCVLRIERRWRWSMGATFSLGDVALFLATSWAQFYFMVC